MAVRFRRFERRKQLLIRDRGEVVGIDDVEDCNGSQL